MRHLSGATYFTSFDHVRHATRDLMRSAWNKGLLVNVQRSTGVLEEDWRVQCYGCTIPHPCVGYFSTDPPQLGVRVGRSMTHSEAVDYVDKTSVNTPFAKQFAPRLDPRMCVDITKTVPLDHFIAVNPTFWSRRRRRAVKAMLYRFHRDGTWRDLSGVF
jgi:hypothetical protein